MLKFTNTLVFIFICLMSFGQIQHGGSPASLNYNIPNQDVPVVQTPQTNHEALKAEDEVVDQIKDIPWRYGFIHYMDISLADGIFTLLPNGDRIWRLTVSSPGAQTINLTFDKYRLAPGASLFVYSENFEIVLGSFTAENNKEHGFLTTALIEGEAVTVELYEPKGSKGLSELHIQRVVHGYRSLDYQKKYIGDSGSCNNNVICPVGDNWRDQIRSVGILLTQNNLSAGFCSGALINNTCNDGKAYFLTANHCGADDPTTVVGFNFESTVCGSNSGPYINNTISGVTKKANNAGSDFMLLELSSIPPASYNVYFSGWNRSGSTTVGQVGIHHPAGDVKKISFDNQSATQATYSGAQCWRVGDWEDGTTEGGSSGSPLFNLDGNIIGQLYGGSASCQSITNDFYGRFDISWDNGSSPADELKTWLDGCNTNAISLAGYDPNAIILNEDAALSFVAAPSANLCADKIQQKLSIRNRGTQVLTSAVIMHGIAGNLSTYNWNGLLNSNESEEIPLDSLSLLSGNYQYEAYIASTNLNVDENPLNDSLQFQIDISNGLEVVLNFTTNFDGVESSFVISDDQGNIIADEDGFNDFESYTYSYCLQAGSYCVNFLDAGGDGLSPTFFWDQGNYQLLVGGDEIINTDNIADGFEYCFVVGEPVDTSTSISNRGNEISFDLFPNPNQGAFNISSTEYIQGLEIINVLGELVQVETIGAQVSRVNTSQLSKGIYFVKIYTDKGTGLKKMLLK